jgi:hypothetical protein
LGKQSDYLFRYENNPVLWASEVLGIHLWTKQKEILQSVFENRRTAVRSGHGVGKTFTAAVAVLAFLFLRMPSKIITSAPTWYQVKDLLWSEINTIFKQKLVPQGCPAEILQTRLRIADDWFAVGLSPKESVNFQGFHQEHILIVLDESPGIRLDILAGAETLMSSGDAHMLQVGNPTSPMGHFYDAFRNPGYAKIHISCYDSPNFTGEAVPDGIKAKLVTPTWVDEKKKEWGEDSPLFQSRVKGEFPSEGSDQLISLTWAEEATRRDPKGGERRLGVDVARFGDDKTVYSIIVDNKLKQIAEAKKDTMHIAGRVKNLAETENIDIIAVDDAGVGGGVSDRLREQGISIIPVNGGESAIDANKFFNRRTEIWWNMREWIRSEGGISDDGNLMADLTAPIFSYTSKGQIKLETKEELKKRIGHSPDYGDSLAIALAAQKRTRLEIIDWLESSRPLARASAMMEF